MNDSLKVWKDEELIMVSALQHYSYCPRQCALIHIEQTFTENIYTLRGNRVHERVDEADSSIEDGIRIERALPIWSNNLGLIGKADLVEFHGQVPYPIEYKHGSRQNREADNLQLCAEAICLEEMLGVKVPKGAIYHFSSRKRREVKFTNILKVKVEETVEKIRQLFINSVLPPAFNDQRCPNCSLIDSCLPALCSFPTTKIKKVVDNLFDSEGE